MNLHQKRLLVVSHYSPDYGGNFIKSFLFLANTLHADYDMQVAFAFPKAASGKAWTEDLHNYKTYFIANPEADAVGDLKKIAADFRPDIVHTNFDGYDMPVAKVFRGGYKCLIVWHLHDPLSFHPNLLKKAYQLFCFYRHYRWYARGVKMAAVSEKEKRFVGRFYGREEEIAYVPNAIDPDRLHPVFTHPRRPYIFLAFGGRNFSKRIDLLLDAAEELSTRRSDFQVWITLGTDTREVVQQKYSTLPAWLILKEQTSDIASLYDNVSCFVSTSQYEAFSYAILEASVSGLPVIQSDIEQTMWNSTNPSTLLFHFPDTHELAERMCEAMDADADEMSRRCKTTSRNNLATYSLSAWAERFIKIYQEA